jgi:hypothetical protein
MKGEEKKMVVNAKLEVRLTHASSFQVRGFKTFQTSMRKVVFGNRTTLHTSPTCWRDIGHMNKVFLKY